MNKLKRKNQAKGITLIALIITIVVLLILAVVTINSVQNRGIIEHAKNATNEYHQGKIKEEEILEGYLAKLEEKEWKDNGNGTVTHYATGATVTIGDYVDYNEGTTGTHTPDTTKGAGTTVTSQNATDGYVFGATTLTTADLKWRVLGINKYGQLELISDNPTPDNAILFLGNDKGYIYAEDNLNNYCNELYGQGTNDEGKQVAEKARSLNVEDINKITHYNPNSYTGYGDIWTYKYPNDDELTSTLTKNMWYRIDKVDGTLVKDWANTTLTGTNYQRFRLPEWGTDKIIYENNRKSESVEFTYYSYKIDDHITEVDGYGDKTDDIKAMLNNGNYWLASCCTGGSSQYADFDVRLMYNGGVNSSILFASVGAVGYNYMPVRPVVTLKPGVWVEKTDTPNSPTNPYKLK